MTIELETEGIILKSSPLNEDDGEDTKNNSLLSDDSDNHEYVDGADRDSRLVNNNSDEFTDADTHVEVDLNNETIKNNDTNNSKSITHLIRNIQPSIVNTIHLSFGFLFIFLGYSPTQNLTTTIHPNDGSLGLGVLYFTFAFGCLVSPLISRKLGLIKSMVLSSLGYSLFIICSIDILKVFYIPSAAIIGLSAAVLWTSQPTYLSRASPSESQLGKYSSIFQSINSTSQIFGNVISGIFATAKLSITTMLIVFGSLTTVGTILLVFLRQIPPKTKEREYNLKDGVKNVLRGFKDVYILIPLLFRQGQTQGYMYGKIPKLAGPDHIGYTMVIFGIATVVGATAWGKIHDKYGKKVLVVIMFILFSLSYALAAITPILPEGEHLYLYYIICGLNGAADSLQSILIFSTIATIFPTDNIAQFSSSRFIMAISTAISFFTFKYIPLYYVLGWLTILQIIDALAMFYVLGNMNRYKKITVSEDVLDSNNNNEIMMTQSFDRNNRHHHLHHHIDDSDSELSDNSKI